MGVEIERKFLLAGDGWREQAGDGEVIRQGYFVTEEERSVRVRLRAGRGTLTIKGRTRGATRAEFEYEIPAEDAEALLDGLVREPTIDKTRYLVEIDGCTFEIDVFTGANEGLEVAEIELADEDADFPRPAWLGEEVTGDPRYYNANLVDEPYRDW